jgi:hypothetical protein
MTWSAQVWHVFKKDVRANWMLGLVVLALAVAMAVVSTSEFDPSALPIVLIDAALPIALGWYMIQPIHADKPARSNEFWATLPLRPAAVATAKLLFLLLVLLALAAVAAVACYEWSVELTLLPRVVATRLVLLTTLATTAALVMVNRRDSGEWWSRALSLIAWPVAILVFIGNTDDVRLQRLADAISPSIQAVAFIGSLVLVVRAYQLRERSRLIGTASVVCCLLMLGGLLRTRGISNAESETLADTSAVTFTPSFSRDGQLNLAITIASDEPGTVQALANASVTVVLADGSRVSTSLRRQRLDRMSSHPLQYALAGQTALSPHDRHPETFSQVPIWQLRKRVPRGAATRVIIDGTIETYVMHEFTRYRALGGTLPPANGTKISLEPDLLTIESAGPSLTLHRRQLAMASPASGWPDESDSRNLSTSFALVDRASRIVEMQTESFNYSEGPPNLLGLAVTCAVYTLHPLNWNAALPAVDSSWLANAYLVAATPRLQHSRRFHAEAQVTAPARR